MTQQQSVPKNGEQKTDVKGMRQIADQVNRFLKSNSK